MPETERQVSLSEYKEKLDIAEDNTFKSSLAHGRAAFTRFAASGYLAYEAIQMNNTEGLTGKAIGVGIAAVIAMKLSTGARREGWRLFRQWEGLRDEQTELKLG